MEGEDRNRKRKLKGRKGMEKIGKERNGKEKKEKERRKEMQRLSFLDQGKRYRIMDYII